MRQVLFHNAIVEVSIMRLSHVYNSLFFWARDCVKTSICLCERLKGAWSRFSGSRSAGQSLCFSRKKRLFRRGDLAPLLAKTLFTQSGEQKKMNIYCHESGGGQEEIVSPVVKNVLSFSLMKKKEPKKKSRLQKNG